VTGGGISAGVGTDVRGNNIENASGWAIQGAGTVVTGNRIVGNASGIQVSGGLVQGNLIANSIGIGMQINGDATVISNAFTGNISTTIVIQSGIPTIQGNNFEGNQGPYDIQNLTANDIPADGNWWGTGVSIPQRIFDYYDEYTYGKVLYTPTASGPIQTAPAYVRSVTLIPASPVGIETATFEMAFSRPMNTETAPQVYFQSLLHNTWTVYNTGNSGLPEDHVYASAADADGSLWFSTNSGVAHFNGTNWITYTTGNSGLPYDIIYAIASDIDGSHWFSTPGYGVAHLDGTTWNVYNTVNSGLPDNNIFAIATSPDGSKWFGTMGGGVVRFDGTNWTVYNTGNSGLPNNTVVAIAAGADGSVWFGTNIAGAARFDGTDWAVFNTGNSELPHDDVLAIAADADGSVWFGTPNGVAHFDGAAWNVYTAVNSGLPNNFVRAIATDLDGSHWFGMNGYGVAHFDGAAWAVYTSANSGLPHDDVYAITVNVDGSHWFGTHGGGAGVLWNYTPVPVETEPAWLDETRYKASYDITALIERGDYRITVAGAVGTDGIEIAPNTATTFTVDYAGAVGDTTAPPQPAVQACAGSAPGHLYASWSASDPDSAIDLYQYAIGTTPGGTDVVNWANTQETGFDRSGLSLTLGQTYYISVRARNLGGLWSEPALPPGVVAGSGMCATNIFTVSLPMITRR
ncbi:MAG: hypothetical protein JXB38_15455, partial [Anaerolineales bacterium]|nr:hypothetical protein [Anaerolineales bacterium]